MEGKKQGTGRETVRACFEKIKEQTHVRDLVNTVLLLCLFAFYALTFFVPRFYGFTERYVGLFVFVIVAALFAINVDPVRKIKQKDTVFFALLALVLVTGINILLVRSGFGCFFVMANFALIWYLCAEIPFARWQFYLFGILYTLMIIYWFFGVYTWMFADYTSFAMNTNTAATFTVFSMLCVLVFLEEISGRYKACGLLIVIALVKCLQISLYHRSRGAFVMLGAYFVLRYLIPRRLWERKGFYRMLCLLATLGSIAFVGIYIALGTTGINFRMPFFYKNIFSGREAIWLEFWNLFRTRPLTGTGTNVEITSFFEFNVHNAMYNILVIHGVMVFALMLFIMFRRWGAHLPQKAGRAKTAAVCAVFAVCFESFFDVDLIWTNYSLNLLFLLLGANAGRHSDEDMKGPDGAHLPGQEAGASV